MKGMRAKIAVKPGCNPRFWKPRPVPFARKDAVENAIRKWGEMGVIKPVPYSEWAAPIVAPIKPDGTARICGDFKVTINPVIELEAYPLPRIEEIFTNLNGGEKFPVIDLKNDYLQLQLDETSRPFMSINTHL